MTKFSGAWMKGKLKFLKNMNCPDQAKCFELLELALDGAVDVKQREQFEMQIKNCMPCYQKYNLDQAIKDLVRTKLENKTAPQGLAENIINQIKSAS